MTTGTLVLLRHGESEWNRANLFTGWVDVPLSEKGRGEAARGSVEQDCRHEEGGGRRRLAHRAHHVAGHAAEPRHRPAVEELGRQQSRRHAGDQPGRHRRFNARGRSARRSRR